MKHMAVQLNRWFYTFLSFHGKVMISFLQFFLDHNFSLYPSFWKIKLLKYLIFLFGNKIHWSIKMDQT